jgi:hypothetical protein
MGWATTVIGAEEEGGFAQYISITVNKTTTKSCGLTIGKVIFQKFSHAVAPSIAEAS